nr:MAG TPA: hypothetical protein [Caudoviricetes sp.]
MQPIVSASVFAVSICRTLSLQAATTLRFSRSKSRSRNYSCVTTIT